MDYAQILLKPGLISQDRRISSWDQAAAHVSRSYRYIPERQVRRDRIFRLLWMMMGDGRHTRNLRCKSKWCAGLWNFRCTSSPATSTAATGRSSAKKSGEVYLDFQAGKGKSSLSRGRGLKIVRIQCSYAHYCDFYTFPTTLSKTVSQDAIRTEEEVLKANPEVLALGWQIGHFVNLSYILV